MSDRDMNRFAINSYVGTFQTFISDIKNGNNLTCEKKVFNDLTSCPLYAAYQTLTKINSLVILLHSPQGCATSMWFLCGGAFSLKATESGSTEKAALTLTTNIDQTGFLGNTDELLYNALIDIQKHYSPKHIIILSTCCPHIMGDDITGTIRRVKHLYPEMSVGWMDTSGVKSWYWLNGYDFALKYLVREVMPQRNTITYKEKLVNIISFGNASSVDEKECVRLLHGIGLQTQTPFSVPYTSIDQIKKASYAKANVMMCKAYGLALCEEMKKKYGTAYVNASHPIGSYFTEKWIRETAALFGVESEAEALIASEQVQIRNELFEIRKAFSGKRIAIAAGHDKIASLLSLAVELGLEIVYAGILTYDNSSKEKFIEISEKIPYDFCCAVNPQSHEEVAILKKIMPDVYIGPAGQTPRVALMNIPTVSCHFNDFMGTFFGFRGVVNYGKHILNTMKNALSLTAPKNYLVEGAEKICGREWLDEEVQNWVC